MQNAIFLLPRRRPHNVRSNYTKQDQSFDQHKQRWLRVQDDEGNEAVGDPVEHFQDMQTNLDLSIPQEFVLLEYVRNVGRRKGWSRSGTVH